MEPSAELQAKWEELKENNENRYTVLVVEDNPEMLSFVSRQLSHEYIVLTAVNGEEALRILDENFVNLIVSDVVMPLMDGFELCKTVKSKLDYSHIPIILLTAKTNIQSKVEGLELGADAYIEKPFSPEYLLAAIASLIKNRETLRQTFAKSPFVAANTMALTKADEEFIKRLNEIILSNLHSPEFNIMKCIVNKLFIGALFLFGALICSCQNTTENTVESSVEGKDTLGFKYIDIVHITHTDYGYTDHALIAVDLHKRFIDVALDLALKTKDEIPENRFAWTVEALDPFYSWWNSASEDRRESMLDMIENKQIGINAMPFHIHPYANKEQWDEMFDWIPKDMWSQLDIEVGMQQGYLTVTYIISGLALIRIGVVLR